MDDIIYNFIQKMNLLLLANGLMHRFEILVTLQFFIEIDHNSKWLFFT